MVNERGSDITWDELVLLYIFAHGAAWGKDLTVNVTGHPQRTYRVIKKLLNKGLIERVEKIVEIEGTNIRNRVVFYILTKEGLKVAKELAKKWLNLPDRS